MIVPPPAKKRLAQAAPVPDRTSLKKNSIYKPGDLFRLRPPLGRTPETGYKATGVERTGRTYGAFGAVFLLLFEAIEIIPQKCACCDMNDEKSNGVALSSV
ncbi:G protein-coupled receptor 176-like protein [Anopheles sinensis]|uniref:G protein-coupled receptor 176-like protein n=1 Tax=Anopheles sinensis TaxID=74873 RepID=A0A084VAZ0_ANOSI|nr:G protein-coupled receptor 176-like protein [Anopheles sinensis]